MTLKKWYWTWEEPMGFISLEDCKTYYEEVRDEYEECGGNFESYMVDATGKNGTLVDLTEALEHFERELEEAYFWDEEESYTSTIVSTIETIKARMEEN